MANSIYFLLSNAEIKKLAEDTASHGEREEDHKDVKQCIAKIIKENSVELKTLRTVDPSAYRKMHRTKNTIRTFVPDFFSNLDSN